MAPVSMASRLKKTMLSLRRWCALTRLVLLIMAVQFSIEAQAILIVVCILILTQAPPGSNDYEYFMNATKLPHLATPALENLYLVGFPIVTAVCLIWLTPDYLQLDRLDSGPQFLTPFWLRRRLW